MTIPPSAKRRPSAWAVARASRCALPASSTARCWRSGATTCGTAAAAVEGTAAAVGGGLAAPRARDGIVRRHAGRGREAPGPVNLMLGCFERILYPRVSRDARSWSPSSRRRPPKGAAARLHAHNGALERGNELAKELGEALPGTIVTTAGGCAAHLATRARPGARQGALAMADRAGAPASRHSPGAERGARRGADASPGAGRHRRPRPRAGGAAARSWRAAAAGGGARSRWRGNGEAGRRPPADRATGLLSPPQRLGVWREPRELIARVGEYVELPSAAACCGGAGSYAIVRPDDSARVLDRHLDEIADADLDMVAVVNPGCYRQLQQGVKRRGLRTRVAHLAELLAGER